MPGENPFYHPEAAPPDVLVPHFSSSKEKKEHLDHLFGGHEPVEGAGKLIMPGMASGCAVDVTTKEYVAEMARLGIMGTWAGSAPGWRVLLEDLSHEAPARRKELFSESNGKAVEETAAYFRERCEHAIRGVNSMQILGDFDHTVECIIQSGSFDYLAAGAGLAKNLPERFAQPDAAHMYYIPIVSTATTVKLFERFIGKKEGNRRPGAYYFEWESAGGHLGPYEPGKSIEQVIAEIRECAPTTPIILAGGIGYRDQIRMAQEVANGWAFATRGILSQPYSGLPRDVIENVYLNSALNIGVDKRSPTGFPSRRVLTPIPEYTPEMIQEAVDICVACLRTGKCKFLQGAAQRKRGEQVDAGPDEIPYCIARELARMRAGIMRVQGVYDGLYFTGDQLRDFRGDTELYGEEGKRTVPTQEQAVWHMLTHDSRKPTA